MFDKIQNYIQELSEQYKQTEQSKDKSYKLPLSDAFFCAEDIIRNKKFYESIKKVVKCKKHKKKGFFTKILDICNTKNKSDKIVCVDAGSGTGILWLYALVSGCDKVIFIEQNPHTIEACKKIIEHFGYTDKSIFINEDATKVTLSEKWDILISETISTDFVTEDFHKIINHLLNYKNKNWIIIPSWFELIFSSSDWKNINSDKKAGTFQEISFSSLDWFKKEKIVLDGMWENTKMKMNIRLYEDIEIKCGESMSLGNERIFDVENGEIILFEG